MLPPPQTNHLSILPSTPPSVPPQPQSQGKWSPTNCHFTAVVIYCTLFFPSLPLPSMSSLRPTRAPGRATQGENSPMMSVILQQYTFTALLAAAGLQRCPSGHLEHLPHAVLCLGGALHVAECRDPIGHVPAFLWLHRLLLDGKKKQT